METYSKGGFNEEDCIETGCRHTCFGMALPAVSRAADDDLQQKMNALTKEVQELRKSVNMTEEKSLSKWLTISGDYRFRVDSMHGQTVAYTNPGKIFTDPTVIAAFTQAGIDTMKTNMRNTNYLCRCNCISSNEGSA